MLSCMVFKKVGNLKCITPLRIIIIEVIAAKTVCNFISNLICIVQQVRKRIININEYLSCQLCKTIAFAFRNQLYLHTSFQKFDLLQ